MVLSSLEGALVEVLILNDLGESRVCTRVIVAGLEVWRELWRAERWRGQGTKVTSISRRTIAWIVVKVKYV